MSRTTKESAARARSVCNVAIVKTKSAASASDPLRRRRPTCKRLRRSEQTGNVIEERQGHQHGEHRHADALPDLERAVGDRTAFDDFRKIIQQMPSVQ